MATATSRMDLRLSESQRDRYERAAAARNLSLTQWSLSHLDEAARADIEEATTLYLDNEAFNAFLEALEGPIPPEMLALLAEDPQWA